MTKATTKAVKQVEEQLRPRKDIAKGFVLRPGGGGLRPKTNDSSLNKGERGPEGYPSMHPRCKPTRQALRPHPSGLVR